MDKFKHLEEEQPPKVKIKGLYEALDLDEEEIKALRKRHAENAMRLMAAYWKIVSRGGNIHRVDTAATAKRRAANKAARKQRRANR